MPVPSRLHGHLLLRQHGRLRGAQPMPQQRPMHRPSQLLRVQLRARLLRLQLRHGVRPVLDATLRPRPVPQALRLQAPVHLLARRHRQELRVPHRSVQLSALPEHGHLRLLRHALRLSVSLWHHGHQLWDRHWQLCLESVPERGRVLNANVRRLPMSVSQWLQWSSLWGALELVSQGSLPERGHVRWRAQPGRLPVSVWRGLHRPALRDQRQWVRLQPVLQWWHLLRPLVQLRMLLFARLYWTALWGRDKWLRLVAMPERSVKTMSSLSCFFGIFFAGYYEKRREATFLFTIIFWVVVIREFLDVNLNFKKSLFLILNTEKIKHLFFHLKMVLFCSSLTEANLLVLVKILSQKNSKTTVLVRNSRMVKYLYFGQNSKPMQNYRFINSFKN